MTATIDLDLWVEKSRDGLEKEFRQAVKCVLESISKNIELSSLMVMKGGLLMAIKYQSPRYTRDIDFSTQKTLAEVNLEEILGELTQGLGNAENNTYGLAFKLQKHEIKPAPKNNPSYPSLHLRIGYANKNDRSLFSKLQRGQSPLIVSIDFSFNEWVGEEAETASIPSVGEISIYSFHEILAEKYRSLLQQPIRRRARYQDVYDIQLLLSTNLEISEDDRALILEKLKTACAAREVPVDSSSFKNPDVKELARKGYEEELLAQLEEAPPNFEKSFEEISNFYDSLPW